MSDESTTDLFDSRLWGRPDSKAVLEKLVVVGPYPSTDFFKSIKQRFAPRDVLLVVDEGGGSSAVEKMVDTVRYACAGRGMVHAKIYLAQWKLGGGKRRRRLLWGSANASTNGFERHAETLSSIPMPPELDDYFEAFKKPVGRVSRRLLELDGGLRLVLPGFDFKSTSDPESFEGWLQAGVLCHKYDADQTFARLSVKLHNPLPKAEAAQILADQALTAASESEVMRYEYVGVTGNSKEDSARWKPAYFVDSWLGHWTSAECFAAKRRTTFRAKDVPARRNAIALIRAASQSQHKKWFAKLTTSMQKAADAFRKTKRHQPKKFFEMNGARVNSAFYEDRAHKQLQLHRAQANDPIFTERFIDGYAFPPVPPFRGASSATYSFDDFAVSVCESVVRLWTKGRVQNQLAQRVRDILVDRDVDLTTMTGARLQRYLSENWGALGDQVKTYWVAKKDRR